MTALRAVAIVAWALALLGATAGYALGQRVYGHGVAYTESGPALPDLDGPRRAINTQLELEPDEAALRRSLRMIRAAGFGWIRQQFAWADLEIGGKGQFYDYDAGRPSWARFDGIVQLAREEGLRVIARLDLPPAWARPPGSYKSHPPMNVQDYGEFVGAFVDHYRGQIGHVQLWNEPNLTSEWGQAPDDPPGRRRVDPAGYVELLKAGYLAAKHADPAVRVLSGELAQTLEPDSPDAQGLDDLIYLDRMYHHGAQPYFDILAANAYGLWTGPNDRRVGPPYANFPRVLLTREVMRNHGDTGKAVWVTEFGWNALPPGWTGSPSPWGQVTPATQARHVVGAYDRARREWPWMGPLALWLFRQPSADARDPTQFFGLVDAEWRPRPVYAALEATALEALGSGVHQESSDGLAFGGTWQGTPDPTASLGGLRESPISGATLRFRFEGTGVDLITPVGPSRGLAYVTINGAATLANRRPRDPIGRATIDFYAPDEQPQRRMPLADGLPDRVHEVELVVSGQRAALSTGSSVGVDAVVVTRAQPAMPALVLAGAWAGSGLALLWLLRDRLLALLEPVAAPALRARAVPAAGHLPWGKVGVFATAASLAFTPLAVQTPVGRFPPAEVLLVGCAAGTALKLYLRGRLAGWWGTFAAPACLLVLAGAVSSVVADYPRLALRELRMLVIEPVLFYFIARTALRGPRDALGLAAVFLGGATAASLLALGQTISGTGLVSAEGVARATGLYPSPNNLALLLDRAVPLALCLALYPVAGARVVGFRLSRRAMRLAAAGGLATAGAALVATFSRGAWLASAVAAGVAALPWLAALPRRSKRRLVIAAGVLAAPVLLATAGLLWRFERFRSLLNPQGTGILRFHVWQASLDMARDFPLWGVGLDQFLYHYPGYMRPEAWREPNLSHPHNLILDFWLRLGLLGLIGLGWIVVRVVRRAWRAWTANGMSLSSGDGDATVRAALVPGAVAALVAAALHGLLDNSYFVVDLAYSFWMLLLVLELASEPPVAPVRGRAVSS